MVKPIFVDGLELTGKRIFESLRTLNMPPDADIKLGVFIFRFSKEYNIIRFWKKDQDEIISEYDLLENGISILRPEGIESLTYVQIPKIEVEDGISVLRPEGIRSLTYVQIPRIEVEVYQKDSPRVKFFWKKKGEVAELIYIKVDLGENKKREGDRIFVGYHKNINNFEARRGASMVNEKIDVPPDLPAVLSGDKILGHKIFWEIDFESEAKKILNDSKFQEFYDKIDEQISNKQD